MSDISVISKYGGGNLSPPDPGGGPPEVAGGEDFLANLIAQIGDTDAKKTQDQKGQQIASKDGRHKTESAKADGTVPGTPVPATAKPVVVVADAVKAAVANSVATDVAADKAVLNADGTGGAKPAMPMSAKKTALPAKPVAEMSRKGEAAVKLSGAQSSPAKNRQPNENSDASTIAGILAALQAVAPRADSVNQGAKPDLAQAAETRKQQPQRDLRAVAVKGDAPVVAAPAVIQPATLQPIVISIPMVMPMMPVEVVEVQEDAGSHKSAPSLGGSSTEDLLNVIAHLAQAKRGGEMFGSRDKQENGGLDSRHRREGEFANLGLEAGVARAWAQVASTDGIALTPNTMSDTSTEKVDVRDAWQLAQVVQGLSQNGVGSVKLRLHPEHLGELNVTLEAARTANGRRELSVSFQASTSEAQEALLGAMPELKQLLKARDLNLASVEINVTNDAAVKAAATSVVSSLLRSMDSAGFTAADGWGQSQGGTHQQTQGQWSSGGDQDRGRGHADSLWERFRGEQDRGDGRRYNPRWHYA